MQRAITFALVAVLAFCVVAASTALACSTDSEGLELINGELPGGG
jgi:hypothetical protein